MSRKVGIVGAAVTPFKATWREKTYYELAQMATREAVKDAGIPVQDIDAAFYGIYNDIFERAAIPEHAIHGLVRHAKQIRNQDNDRRSHRGLHHVRRPCLPGGGKV